MSYTLWTLLSLVVYIIGIVVLIRTTPHLLRYAYDQLAFAGYAALEIIGALCAFGAVTVTYGLFNGSFAINLLDFLLLVGIVVVGSMQFYKCFKSCLNKLMPATRIIAGIYFLLLILAALYYIALLFGA